MELLEAADAHARARAESRAAARDRARATATAAARGAAGETGRVVASSKQRLADLLATAETRAAAPVSADVGGGLSVQERVGASGRRAALFDLAGVTGTAPPRARLFSLKEGTVLATTVRQRVGVTAATKGNARTADAGRGLTLGRGAAANPFKPNPGFVTGNTVTVAGARKSLKRR
jgi:hypothetical protein